jgi:hypothetical protein
MLFLGDKIKRGMSDEEARGKEKQEKNWERKPRVKRNTSFL